TPVVDVTSVVDVTAVGPAGGARAESVTPRGPLPAEDVASGPPRPVRAFATVTILGAADPVPGGNDEKNDREDARGNIAGHDTSDRGSTDRTPPGHHDPRATDHGSAGHGSAGHGATGHGAAYGATGHGSAGHGATYGSAGQADHRTVDHRPVDHDAVVGVARLGELPAGPDLPAVLPVDVFEQAAAGLADRAEALAAQADDLPAAERALERARQEETRATADLAGHTAGEQLARTRAQECRARAERQRASLPPELRDVGRLAARQREVAQFADAYSDCHAAASATALAEEEYRRAATGAGHDAHDAGFPDVAAAQAACREEGWILGTEARLTAYRDDLVTVRSQLASPQLAVDPDTPAPVAEREAEALAARQRHEAALTEAARAGDRARRLSDLVPAFAAAFAAVPPLREAAAELRGLAELATGRGGNRHGMPLSSFVLAARLEEVAAAASGRLAAMSGGRFTLVHDSGERRDRRRRAGLGLLVEDAWTGRRRDTATLSGGETFQAALSLALGLADVVTAESGGQAMDALFIDEGFGSLDPDSLEEVMNVLDSLRSGGRLVGIVSHVADLRQRIPTQITVIKQPHGSHVRTTI
ncbi:SbcC/MukB-like Walker B domain-containing protein, partial [Frankia sp. CiP1_Cm_nod2]